MMELDKPVRQVYEEVFEEFLNTDYIEKFQEPPNRQGGGRTYDTPADLAKRAVEYFVLRYQKDLPPTMESMRVFMRFWSKQAFYAYRETMQYQPDFKRVIDVIRALIEAETSDALYNKNKFNGARFILQCGWNWTPTEKVINENHDIQVTIGKKKIGN